MSESTHPAESTEEPNTPSERARQQLREASDDAKHVANGLEQIAMALNEYCAGMDAIDDPGVSDAAIERGLEEALYAVVEMNGNLQDMATKLQAQTRAVLSAKRLLAEAKTEALN